ncbi:hypothetical protein [Allobaculum stercoricanis]|nr:hypothetical protein [Allobaculum stercoricanis]
MSRKPKYTAEQKHNPKNAQKIIMILSPQFNKKSDHKKVKTI